MKGQYAAFSLGKEKGIYRDAGIDLDVLEGTGSGNTVKAVASKTDTFGIADAGTIIKSDAQGVNLKITSVIIQKTLLGILAWADSGIKSPKDLEGQSLGQTPGDAIFIMFPAFVAATGIDRSKITEVSLDPNAKTQTFLAKRLPAITADLSNLPPQYYEDPSKFTLIRFSEVGITNFGDSLFVDNETLSAKPDLVSRFTMASLKAFEYSKDHVDETADAAVKEFPQTDRATLVNKIKDSMAALHTPNSDGKPIAWTSPKDWQAELDFLQKYLDLGTPAPLDTYYTDQFVPKG
jgi:NitT/TauT family transport system substrate-binding protein